MGRTTYLALALLAGCNDGAGDFASKLDLQLIEQRLDAASRRSMDELLAENRSTLLKPGEPHFSAVRTNIGALTFSLGKVEPFGNGSVARLEIGNPTSAAVIRLKMEVDWGETDAEGSPVMVAGRPAQRTIDAVLVPGKWNNASINLPNVPPEKLGFIHISKVEAERISLATE